MHDAAELEHVGSVADAGDRPGTSPERLMLSTEVQDRITAAMGGLSAMERGAFVLRHFEGRSIEEISTSLGLKTNAAKHSIFRAVRKMRAALEPLMADPAPGGARDLNPDFHRSPGWRRAESG